MQVKVFKFGGASVKDAAAIENLYHILQRFPNDHLVVVISAMGKSTNFLEKVLKAYYQQPNAVPILVAQLEQQHLEVAQELLPEADLMRERLDSLFCQLRERLSVAPSSNYDFDYDQIVSFGELLSTTLISEYLNLKGMKNSWLDARRLVRTDATYREGRVDWKTSCRQIKSRTDALFQHERILLTQGFIGGTAENLTTTLGREGSDFSAAIMAYALEAESVTIWKDVAGLLNADPKRFEDTVKLDRIPYEEAVELAYYGASIIHPKTLKPLQNKQIPLYVRSFFHPDEEGSVITSCPLSMEVPSYIVKEEQWLISISPRDFSFIAVDNLSDIFAVLSQFRIRINMMQNSALSFSVCTDSDSDRVMACIEALRDQFRVKYNAQVQLITIRHYTDESVNKMLRGREVLLRQASRTTIQFVVK